MKKLLFISGLFLAAVFTRLAAQELNSSPLALDTIYANDQKNVALFFPQPIRQGITGSENFVFTFNREMEQHLGLLQATPGKESNLLVISTSGAVFSFILKYSERLEKLNYFIADAGSIGNEDPHYSHRSLDNVEELPETKTIDSLTEREMFYQNFSPYLLKKKQRLGNLKKQKEGVELKVENIVFHDENLFFVLRIENDSPIDYEPAFMNISVVTRKQGKNTSVQKLVQKPTFKYKMPDKISKGKTSRFVYVLPKFSISEDRQVVIDLKEENGERDVQLKIKKEFINNPN